VLLKRLLEEVKLGIPFNDGKDNLKFSGGVWSISVKGGKGKEVTRKEALVIIRGIVSKSQLSGYETDLLWLDAAIGPETDEERRRGEIMWLSNALMGLNTVEKYRK
jgi:hypothetical protein